MFWTRLVFGAGIMNRKKTVAGGAAVFFYFWSNMVLQESLYDQRKSLFVFHEEWLFLAVLVLPLVKCVLMCSMMQVGD